MSDEPIRIELDETCGILEGQLDELVAKLQRDGTTPIVLAIPEGTDPELQQLAAQQLGQRVSAEGLEDAVPWIELRNAATDEPIWAVEAPAGDPMPGGNDEAAERYQQYLHRLRLAQLAGFMLAGIVMLAATALYVTQLQQAPPLWWAALFLGLPIGGVCLGGWLIRKTQPVFCEHCGTQLVEQGKHVDHEHHVRLICPGCEHSTAWS